MINKQDYAKTLQDVHIKFINKSYTLNWVSKICEVYIHSRRWK